MPLSFSRDPFFTLPVQEYSLRWYYDFFGNERWLSGVFNSLVAAGMTTVLATTLGTMAALGISRPDFPARRLAMAVLISPMIVPIMIVAVGSYLFLGQLGLTNTRTGLILAHTMQRSIRKGTSGLLPVDPSILFSVLGAFAGGVALFAYAGAIEFLGPALLSPVFAPAIAIILHAPLSGKVPMA